jgi:glycosyltransferase involved in cell wall biosynthesis
MVHPIGQSQGENQPDALRVLLVISRLDPTGGAGRSVAEMAMSLRQLSMLPEVACFRRTGGQLETDLEASGIAVHDLAVDHLVPAISRLRHLVRRERPDIVHTTMYAADQAGRLATIHTGIPVISSVINPTHDPSLLVDETCPVWRRRAMWALDGLTARHFTSRLHAVTNAVKESAVRGLRVNPDRVTTVYRSRDASRLGTPTAARRDGARRSLGIGDRRLILTIGRQTEQKGQLRLVEALGRIAPAHRDVMLVIAGAPGPSTPRIARRIRELRLDDRVQLLGHRDDVGDLLTAADVFAFPSQYEGLGGVLVEAMALGLPIVASDLPAIREVTDDGHVALLVPPGDPVALAGALELLLTDRELSRTLGTRGRDRYRQCFTPERAARELIEMYRTALIERGRARRKHGER